jgi:hypothetical protein
VAEPQAVPGLHTDNIEKDPPASSKALALSRCTDMVAPFLGCPSGGGGCSISVVDIKQTKFRRVTTNISETIKNTASE